MLMKSERELIINYGKKMLESQLTTGSGGNISIYNRDKNLIAISPSGDDYINTRPKDIVIIDLDGNIIEGDRKPSSEMDMHIAMYKNKKYINAVVHTHSEYATTISSMGWELEAVHYLIAMAGYNVRCAEYAIYGSKELAENALRSIKNRNAVLLRNHGLISIGKNLERAFAVAQDIEFVSKIYYRTKNLGEPELLSREEIKEVMLKFGNYDELYSC